MLGSLLATADELPATMKLRVMARALALRARCPDLFARGHYCPLQVGRESWRQMS